jgi:uncharacterized protein (TIGR04551 family)
VRALPSILAASFAVSLSLGLAAPARATGFTDIGDDIRAQTETTVKFTGTLRLRGTAYDNLDLDRGPTPSGQLFFPVPVSNPSGQWLEGADMRLRTDLAFYAPFASVAVKVRLDAPDNLTLGTTPDGIPAGSTTVLPTAALRIKRAYGEALTPFGVLSAGRMGSQWGLGMLTNGGDCANCDSGDAADRIAFITPLGGFIWAAAFDFTATEALVSTTVPGRAIDIDPSTDVRTLTFAFLRWKDDRARTRRRLADKGTFEFGAYVTHRWQENDAPTTYLPVPAPLALSPSVVMYRGYTATAADGWLRLTLPWLHLEAEGVVLTANVAQPSLIPGVLYRVPVTSLQIGAVMESEFGAPEDTVTGGLDAGFASGQDAPGFGVNTGVVNPPQAQPGDLSGSQLNLPTQNQSNTFRFHPDYQVDRILFHEIIGTVAGAYYFRPHVRVNIVHLGPSTLQASLAGIVSFADYALSAPGGKTPLGVELDPTLSWGSKDGFGAALEHAALFPLPGLDNTQLGLKAKPAQLIRLRLTYGF